MIFIFNSAISAWIYRTHWDQRGAKWFAAMLLLIGGQSLFTLLQSVAPGKAVASVFYHIASAEVVFSIPAFAVFVARYTGTDFHRRRHWRAVLVVTVVAYIALILTSPLHDLVVVEATLYTEPVRYLGVQNGLAEPLLGTPLAILWWYSVYVLSKHLLSTGAGSGTQLLLLVLGLVPSVLLYVAASVGLLPSAPGYRHEMWGMLAFSVCTTVALFRFDLLDVKPVARTAVVENLRDPVVVLDDQRRVVDYNTASETLWPDIDSAVGQPLGTACPDLAAAVDVDDPDLDSPERLTLAVDGQERHYSVTISRVGDAGDGRDWLSLLLRDVTQLERSRWQLRKQKEQLDKVASTISHDLRNPINVADGYAERLQDIAEAEITDPEAAQRATEYTDKIHGTHDRMTDIISDILTIAREGKTVEETEPVALDAVARDAWANVDTDDATLAVADTRRLQADRSKLLTTFENLLRNSVEHGLADPESSSVTVTVGVTDDGFYVADDGPGIPEEHVGNLFEYGYTTTDDGTGLGLSIVETMAESHGWTVELDESAPGARFVFGNVSTDAVTDSTVSTAGLS
ncbi:ATP-binding protein [Halorientalis regularis]|uniref:histidine kinase n=1 Tax=Halorientalis regularis TaxID=660518 RepID=A0A1G7GNI2_9EURY|nr:ATP-binding protein [Halorientalis regularis]SDE89672.1 Signal transduction histidine kinase [Halorientalis regularis]